MANNQNNQTNENKKAGSQVKKPTVTKTTVKKSNDSGKVNSKTTGNKTGTKTTTTAGNRTGTSKTATTGNRTGTSKTATTGNRTGTSKTATSGNKTGTNRKKRKKKKGLSGAQKSLIVAAVFGLLMAMIITCIMRGSLLSTTQIAGEFYLDSYFDINNFVETKNEKAYLIFDNASFQPESIGDYEIEYTVQYGKLKTKKKITIHVADADTPLISGPEKIAVLVGEEIQWADYYQVIDSQPGLEESIVSNVVVDTSQVGRQTVTLRVTDWYNNSSTKEITVIVKDLQGKYKYTAKAVRQYKIDYGISTNASVFYVYTSKENTTYVLLGTNVIYIFNEDGTCSEYEYDTENETEIAAFQELLTEIMTDGEQVEVLSISDFI